MQIVSKVSWTQEELEQKLEGELANNMQTPVMRTVKIRQRKKKGEKASKIETRTAVFHWVINAGQVFVTADTTPMTSDEPSDNDRIVTKAIEILTAAQQLARGGISSVNELPAGVTMDTLEGIMASVTAQSGEVADEGGEQEVPAESEPNLNDLLHKSRKLMKNESRERP